MPDKQQIALVGPRIRALRKDHALTQADLAAKIGIQQSDLCRMESGEYKVSLETLFKILKVFEMNVAEFFRISTAGSLTPDERDLLTRYRSLSPPSKESVHSFLAYTEERMRSRARRSSRIGQKTSSRLKVRSPRT